MDFEPQAIHRDSQMLPAGYLPGPPATPVPAPETTDVREYIRIFLKRRWLILTTALGIFGAAAVAVFTQPRVYRATATVRLAQPQPVGILIQPSQPATQISLTTEVKTIQSSLMAKKVAEFIKAEHQLVVDPQEIQGSVKVAIEEPDVLAINVEHTDPDRAVLIANAVQSTYIAENTALARLESASAESFLEAQLELVKRDLDRFEEAIARYKTQHHITERDTAAQIRAGLTPDYSLQAQEAQAELQAAMAHLATLRARLATQKPLRRVRRPINDPVAEGLREAMVEAEVELNRAQAQYEENHPMVIALRNKLNGIRKQLQARSTNKEMVEIEEPNPLYEALQQRIQEQEAQVEAAKMRLSVLTTLAAKTATKPSAPEESSELTRLQNAQEIAYKAHVALLEQLQQVRLNKARQQGTARRLDVASRPNRPIRPTPGRTLALAAIVGIFSGFSLAILRELADTSVNDPDQLLMRTGISSLGFIPAAHSAIADPKITALLPKSPLSEGFRMVHANLKFASLDSPVRTLMVTSAAANEGKSVTALNLAIVYAQAGVNTLLVDSDLRRPALHRAFGLEHSPGLTNVLAGQISLAEAIRPTPIPHLRLLPSGTIPPNPTALLDSHRMEALIEELKGIADVVVFDTPPALAVADSLVLSARVDSVVLVVEQGKVNARALREIRHMIEQARGKIAGAVINKVKRGLGDYYYYYHYYYYYYSDRDRDGKRLGRRHRRALLDATQEPAGLPDNGEGPKEERS